jgi:hypothetical protein
MPEVLVVSKSWAKLALPRLRHEDSRACTPNLVLSALSSIASGRESCLPWRAAGCSTRTRMTPRKANSRPAKHRGQASERSAAALGCISNSPWRQVQCPHRFTWIRGRSRAVRLESGVLSTAIGTFCQTRLRDVWLSWPSATGRSNDPAHARR